MSLTISNKLQSKKKKKSFTILRGQESTHFLPSLCFTNLALQRLWSLTFSVKLNYNWVGKTLCQFMFCAPLSKVRPPTLEMKGMWILVYGLISLISTCVRMLRSKSETQSNNLDRAKMDLLGKNYICWIKIIFNKCCSLNFCQISLLAWAHIHIQNNSLIKKPGKEIMI